MTIVPDTNVIVSGILIPTGIEAHIIHLWRDAKLQFAISPSILGEYRDVLHRPKIRQHTNLSEQEINILIMMYPRNRTVK